MQAEVQATKANDQPVTKRRRTYRVLKLLDRKVLEDGDTKLYLVEWAPAGRFPHSWQPLSDFEEFAPVVAMARELDAKAAAQAAAQAAEVFTSM